MSLSNIRTIAAHEWRNALRTRSVFVSAIVLGATLLLAMLVGWQNARTLNADRNRYQETVRSNWVEQPDRHPHRSAHYGYLAFRPKSTLSFFDSGVDSYTGTSVFLEAHKQNTTNFSEARHSNGLLRFGELNLALILQLLVPLLIFFLGFGAIASEREAGILNLTLSQGVGWRELLIGKTVGLLAVIFALLTPLLTLSLGLWLVLNDFRVPADAWLRLSLLLAGYAGFFTAVAVIAVVVSAFSRTGRAALITLIAIWIAFWIVIPRATQNIGAGLHPAPTKFQFDRLLEADLAKEGDSHNPNDPKFAELKREVLAQHGVSDVKDLPFNYGGFVMARAEEISSEIFRRHYGEMLAVFRRQNRIAEWTALANPYLAIRHFSMAAAGSDFSAYEDFQWKSEEFRFNMIQKLNDLHMNRIKAENDRAQKVEREIWNEFPAFEYREPTLGESFGRQRTAVVALVFWFAIALSALAVAPGRR